ncbi:hypothetical protein J2R96_002247 [Bradyrhizobium elkanii]|nr:hypothetical protein [Bradyrhizobium elkanii]
MRPPSGPPPPPCDGRGRPSELSASGSSCRSSPSVRDEPDSGKERKRRRLPPIAPCSAAPRSRCAPAEGAANRPARLSRCMLRESEGPESSSSERIRSTMELNDRPSSPGTQAGPALEPSAPRPSAAPNSEMGDLLPSSMRLIIFIQCTWMPCPDECDSHLSARPLSSWSDDYRMGSPNQRPPNTRSSLNCMLPFRHKRLRARGERKRSQVRPFSLPIC